jgi:chromosome partitioning protein
MPIIAFTNHKGGVGKTTSVFNIGYSLAKLGYKVGLVDADSQAHLTLLFTGLEFKTNIFYITQNNKNLNSELFTETKIENLFILPSTKIFTNDSLNYYRGGGGEFNTRQKSDTWFVFAKIFELIQDFDYILMDCPISLENVSINAIIASDYIITPLKPDTFSLEGFNDVHQTLEVIKSKGIKHGKLLGGFLTMVNNTRKTYNEEFRAMLLNNFPLTKIFDNHISRLEIYADSLWVNQPAMEYKSSSNEYQFLTKEIIKSL